MDRRPVHRKRLLIFRLSLLLVAGFLATSLVSYVVSRSSLRRQINDTALPLTSDTIYSEIQRDLLEPILVSSLMAHDTFFRDWVIDGEKDQAPVAKYLHEIMAQFDVFTTFFVSEATQTYYHADGILKQVRPEEERDAWYFRVQAMAADYEINVDPDMANRDVLTIFINHRVLDYDGNYIGATGVGLTTDAVTKLIDSYRSKYDRNIYFVDRDGKVVLKGSSAFNAADNIRRLEGISSVAEAILSGNKTTLEYSQDGHTVHLNTRFIPELDWYLLVEQTEQGFIRSVLGTFALNIVICVLITVVAIILTTFTVNAYEKINREQQEKIIAQHQILLENNRALEQALAHVETLQDILPICMHCHKIRTDQQSWERLESYIEGHSGAKFSHGLCPQCLAEHYPKHVDGKGAET